MDGGFYEANHSHDIVVRDPQGLSACLSGDANAEAHAKNPRG